MPFNLMTLMRYGPVALFLAPWILVALSWLVAPTYYGNAISDPICIGLLIGMLVWDVLGLGLTRVAPSALVKFLVFLFFTLPLCIGASIVPAVVTILHALAPILFKR